MKRQQQLKKKVLLNLDNKTWDWANSQDNEKPCYTYHTADVNFVNKTTQDVYLYYMRTGVKGQIKYIKIQAGQDRKLESLTTKKKNIYDSENMLQIKYDWVVSYELYSNLNNYDSNKIELLKWFESGNFTIEDCETKTIKIQD